jgi:hypothetical protein
MSPTAHEMWSPFRPMDTRVIVMTQKKSSPFRDSTPTTSVSRLVCRLPLIGAGVSLPRQALARAMAASHAPRQPSAAAASHPRAKESIASTAAFLSVAMAVPWRAEAAGLRLRRVSWGVDLAADESLDGSPAASLIPIQPTR